MLKVGIASGEIEWGNSRIGAEIGWYFFIIGYCWEDEWSIDEEGWRDGWS